MGIEAIYAAAARAGLLQHITVLGQTFRYATGWVEWRAADESILHERVQAPEITITFPTTQFPGIRLGDLVRLAGQDYEVREVRRIHDGAESRARLSTL